MDHKEQSVHVYCYNCKYFADFFTTGPYCKAPTGRIVNDPIWGRYKERVNEKTNSPYYPTKCTKGECKLYKRKWWKFWVVQSKN